MKKIVLLIGSSGNMGMKHYRVLNKLKKKYDFDVYTCDNNYKKLANYMNYSIAIPEINPDYVIIATPTSTHKEIIDYCLRKKVKNIFVEKPISDVIEGLSKYKDNTNLMVGHIERFNPIVKEIKNLINGKKIDTIICTRSGLKKIEDDFNVDIDLCIHDIDVCQYILNQPLLGYNSKIINNSCNLWFETTGLSNSIIIHADNKSLFKRRMIQIIGTDVFIEGDYINQTLTYNGKKVKIKKQEPLKIELEHFLSRKYNNKELRQAINNVKWLKS